jgi:hypothetical protein
MWPDTEKIAALHAKGYAVNKRNQRYYVTFPKYIDDHPFFSRHSAWFYAWRCDAARSRMNDLRQTHS